MYYSVIGFLSVIVHCIINHDALGRDGGSTPVAKQFRRFLLSVIAYHFADALWGIFSDLKLEEILFADTVVYFVVMALSVLLWTKYVLCYLEEKHSFARLLSFVGMVFFVSQIIAVAVNAFVPILFYFDGNCEYHVGIARHITFITQIVMFLMTSIYSFAVSAKSVGSVRRRHITIGLFGLAMIFSVTAQIFFPLLPLYSIGYMLGGCVLHSFVVEDEKKEYQRELEEALGREEVQKHELGRTRNLAYTDPLTRAKNKLAYKEAVDQIDKKIADGLNPEFAAVMFDINDLKHINDSGGHDKGDAFILSASTMIRRAFRYSSVYRIGGDEFAAILEDEDFDNRDELIEEFNRKVEENRQNGQVVVSAGIAVFDPETDKSFADVFKRADDEMYRQKKAIKEQK